MRRIIRRNLVPRPGGSRTSPPSNPRRLTDDGRGSLQAKRPELTCGDGARDAGRPVNGPSPFRTALG